MCKCHDEFCVFHRMQETSCLDKGLVASKERLVPCSYSQVQIRNGGLTNCLCGCEFLLMKHHNQTKNDDALWRELTKPECYQVP